MPLFKKHHDTPADTNYSGPVNDPNYAMASEYPLNANTGNSAGGPQASHLSGVGAPVDSSYGNQTALHHGHPGTATAGGTAAGAAAGHELGGHAGPGAAVGGVAGHHASHQHNQPTTGYNQADTGYYQSSAGNNRPNAGYEQVGYGQSTTGYGGPGAVNSTTGTSHHPVRNEVGGTALGAEAGHHMGGHAGTGAATGGLAGREHAHHTGNVHNTAATANTTGNMSTRDAKSLEMKGKAQQLAGMLLSSQSMKAKGNAKEQEAAAIRHHQTNIAEAEAHEAQARLARERAGHGPHH